MKVGDKVRSKLNTLLLTKGKLCEVLDVYDNEITVKKGGCFWYHESNFELVKEQTMKKKDLKNGMVVEYRVGLDDDKFAMVVNNKFLDLTGYVIINSYNDDLINQNDNDFDIIAVYEVDGYGNGLIDILKGNDLNKLWQREETKEMTLSQISKELGYDIKVVKEAK